MDRCGVLGTYFEIISFTVPTLFWDNDLARKKSNQNVISNGQGIMLASYFKLFKTNQRQ